MTRQVDNTAGRERRLKELKAQYRALIESTARLKEISDEITTLEEYQTPSPEKAVCGDCGVTEGEIHEYECDMEVCPFCGGQLISCNCDIDEMKDEPFSEIFDEDIEAISTRLGVSSDEIVKIQKALLDVHYESWQNVLEKKGRVPFIEYPIICARCGVLWPHFFKVPDDEWEHYIQPDERSSILCRECYNEIKALIDNAQGDRDGGEERE